MIEGRSLWFGEPGPESEPEEQSSFEPLISALMTAVVALAAQQRQMKTRILAQGAVQRGLVSRVAEIQSRLKKIEEQDE